MDEKDKKYSYDYDHDERYYDDIKLSIATIAYHFMLVIIFYTIYQLYN